ncbi:hypothetical protein HY642_06995 [Candidatus Woesearchaeota archaeon]|nr:hypothetical protein [Candidatus Woesearchaeota archaeon]
MAKRSLATKAAVGLGKGLWWTAKGTGKLLWWGTKKTASGVAAVAKKAKDAKQNKPATKAAAVLTPVQAVKVAKGDYNTFERRLHKESMILLVVGRRGSGKSVTGFRLLENINAAAKRPCFAIGPKQSSLPAWIHSIESVEQATNGGVILVDEGAIAFSSRDAMSDKNKDLGKLLAIARHKDLTLILITQNTGMIDNNVLRLCDTLVFKEGSLLQERFERSAIKDLYETANAALVGVPAEQRQGHCYVLDASFEGLCAVALPSFWNSSVSKNQA